MFFIHLDDEIDPKDVDKDKSVPFGEESPGAKDRIEGRCEVIEGSAHQPVENTTKLNFKFWNHYRHLFCKIAYRVGSKMWQQRH